MIISIIIITRNRADFLDHCLASIVNQAVYPREVIVVDNASTDHTQSVIEKYKKILPIKLIRETRIGIPYARNTGMTIARGNIIAFLDDDCIASGMWLSSIEKFFIKYPSAIGVIGNTSVSNNTCVPALVEFTYNYRWVVAHVNNPKKISKIRSGVVVDTKNAAFRLEFSKQFLFSAKISFGDAGNNEDAEIGFRMFQKNHNIYYNPSIKASHVYSATLSRLLWRNFWGGYGDALLLLQNGVNLRSSVSKPSIHEWIFLCHKISKHLSVFQKALFFLLIFIYPLFSRVGRLIVKTTWVLKLPISIPQR